MARRKRPKGHPPSRGYRQARRAKARIEKHAARQARYAARVWANRVADNHQLIAVEDLRLKFLAASRMARKAADIALGATRRERVERAVRAGRQVVNVAPAYTTMTCSSCFARTKQRLGLAERIFRCRDCGNVADRDRNAARTILALAERGQTGVDGVSHAAASPPGVAVAVRPELQIPRALAVGNR
jgi:putative transposase